MVEISKFNRPGKWVVFETDGGKLRLTFVEWKRIVDMFEDWDVEKDVEECKL